MKAKLIGITMTVAIALVAILPVGVAARPDGEWVQSNADGFGELYNPQITGLAKFGEYLYAGVWHVDDDDWSLHSQIWRTFDSENWELVYDAEANGPSTLIVFKDYLYSANWLPYGRVVRSQDGVNWEDVTGELVTINLDTARMAVYKNYLYISTWSEFGAEIWRTADGMHWQPFITAAELGDVGNNGAISSETFKGHLYWGTLNEGNGAQLWRTDGATTQAVMTGGLDMQLVVISALATYNNYLYMSGNSGNAFQVWRSADGVNWEHLFTLPESIGWASALEVFGNQLYLVTESDYVGLEVWRTANGTTWEQFVAGGFGDAGNEWSNWDNGTTVFRDKLFIATINWYTGGEIWKYCPTGCK